MKSYFRYIRGNYGKGLGAVQVNEYPHGQFKIGISICNPTDEFSKEMAHKIAEENLEKSNIYDFYEIIDGDWLLDIVDSLPRRDGLDGIVPSTIWDIADDIMVDYARSHYKTLI